MGSCGNQVEMKAINSHSMETMVNLEIVGKNVVQSYLPGSGVTVILKAGPSGRGLAIAPRLG